MIYINKIEIKYMLKITDDQLWDFHVRNDICEVGHERKIAVKPLCFNRYIVALFMAMN